MCDISFWTEASIGNGRKMYISAKLLRNFRISVYLQHIQDLHLGKIYTKKHIMLASWQCSTFELRSDLGDVTLLAFTFERNGAALGVGLEGC